MRGLIGACLALGTLSNVAAAADLGGGSKGDPYAAPSPIWSGLYVGAAVGYGFATSKVSDSFGTSLDVTLRGEHGAVAVGYDFQLGPRWVAGVFADYALGTALFQGGDLGLSMMAIDNQWAIGGRLGVLVTPSTLLYGSAGYTAADLEATTTTARRVAKGALEGYFVGFGGEQALNRNLYLKVDYRFSAYGEMTDSGAVGPVTFDDNNVHSLRLGVSYRFGM